MRKKKSFDRDGVKQPIDEMSANIALFYTAYNAYTQTDLYQEM